jgi:hypothetical protein
MLILTRLLAVCLSDSEGVLNLKLESELAVPRPARELTGNGI